jgi:hypothetical protein
MVQLVCDSRSPIPNIVGNAHGVKKLLMTYNAQGERLNVFDEIQRSGTSSGLHSPTVLTPALSSPQMDGRWLNHDDDDDDDDLS